MFVTVNGAKLYFDVLNPQLVIGADNNLTQKPTLICLPGGPGGDHQILRPAFDRFAAHAQVIYLDPRGAGRSDAGKPEDWTLAQWGDDVAAFADALGIEKPIVLGVSGGALITASYISRHPKHAGGAILVNACARLDKEAIIAGFASLGGPPAGEAWGGLIDRGGAEEVAAFFQTCMQFYSRTPAAIPFSPRARVNFAVSHHFFTGGGEAFRFDLRDKLGAVECPVLALVGTHDPVTRPAWGRELAAALPPGRCELVEFENSSHVIDTDEPERFYAVVERFLAARG
jgi:pimeloyl-ACP methyl ester carboxylesterase